MRKALLLILMFLAAVPAFGNIKIIDIDYMFDGGISSVTLAWDPPSPATGLVGYKIYFGTASANYSSLGSPINVGNVTTYTVSGLARGTKYYFAVTAVYSGNQESGFSNEISTTIPACGDVNGDGKANTLDLQYLINIYLGVTPNISAADLNKDGWVDAGDIQLLVLILLKLGSCPSS